jgi:hypothetical protein
MNKKAPLLIGAFFARAAAIAEQLPLPRVVMKVPENAGWHRAEY